MLAGVGLTATVGQVCLTKAFTSGQPAKVSVIGLSQIIFALVLDVIFFKRTYTWTTLLGIALVAAPTAWLMAHRRPRPARKVAPRLADEAASVT
jgi:drug/metabolite transporter (DMT)-like permease